MKIGFVLFDVIPAKAGIQCQSVKVIWTPVFTGETNRVRFFHAFPETITR